MGVFNELSKQKPTITKGKIWLTMLIEYDTLGNAKILRSFSKPAKESSIKFLKKDKKKEEKKKFIINEEVEKEDLFG